MKDIATGSTSLNRSHNFSHRETDDAYIGVIIARGNWRVIRCSDGIQWIVQTRAPRATSSKAWRSLSFHVERSSLVNAWRRVAADAGIELLALPDRFVREVSA